MSRTNQLEILSKVSPRELECLRLRCKGYTNRGAAYKMFLEPATVRNHVARAFERSGISSIADFCYKLGRCDECIENLDEDRTSV